jgi:hypothetical protein
MATKGKRAGVLPSRKSESKTANKSANKSASKSAPKTDHPVERDPAVEWGERIATSKDIARGGKKQGFVPGASEQPKKK